MGSVDLVYDDVRGHAVARKQLSATFAGARLHFKSEFRMLSRLQHPNLVRVHELAGDDDALCFIMEAVEGQPFDQYCSSRHPETALSHALPQLLDALAFVHAHGVVHRDLKPGNVLVTAEGMVKLLDFGLLGQAAARVESGIVAGTPGYMAPEQIRGEAPVPASDLYAVGCMVFEVLARRAVFEGATAGILRAHLTEKPPCLRDVDAGASPLFDAMCRELLDKRPERRPTAAALLDRLDSLNGDPLPPRPPRRILGDLMGRDDFLEQAVGRLRAADAPSVLALVGPSGVGKSVLCEYLARQLERDGRLMLRGSARPAERVPFNAIDAAIDDLARAVARRQGPDPELRASAQLARSMFPVLATSGVATAERCKELVRFRLFGEASPVPRARVFDAVLAIITRLVSSGGPAVIAIDDFQWADDDSLALLTHFAASEDAPTLLLALREDVGETAAGRWLRSRPGVERLGVPPLAREVLSEIVHRVASASGREPPATEIARAVAACEGRPFLAEVAGHALATMGQSSLDQVVRGRPPLEREVLGLLSAADGWLPVPAISRMLGCRLGIADETIQALASQGLVRRGGAGGIEGVADVFHDGVRVAVSSALQDAVRRAHDRLAEHWLADPDSPPERRVRHLLASGRRPEAALQAAAAARRAESQRAFGLAADMYEIVVRESAQSTEQVREQHARALERAGRHLQAARAWQALARSADAARRVDLALHEAHALMAANRAEAGLDRLDAALLAAGEPESHARDRRSVLAAATFVLGPRGRYVRRLLDACRSRARHAHALGLSDAERDVRIGILLCFLDAQSGVRFLLRARDRFAAVGAPDQEALCNYMFAVLALVGSRRARVPLAERYLARARSLLGARRSPMADGMVGFVDGLQALRHGRWFDARRGLDKAAADFEECGAVTERLLSASWSMMADAYRQDLASMQSHLAHFRRELGDLEGAIVASHVELLDGYVQFLQGKHAEAWATIGSRVTMHAGRRPNQQRAAALLYRMIVAIYRDDPDDRREFLARLGEFRQYRFLETMYAGSYAMIGALLESNALRRGERGASQRRVEWFARRMEGSPPLMAGASERARAYAADARGERGLAIVHLARAEALAGRFDRRIDVAIARYQRGLRIHGREGRDLCAHALAEAKDAGAGELLLREDAGLR